MLPIQWRAEAQVEPATVLDYIAEHNQQAAFDLYGDIDRTVSQLPYHPYLSPLKYTND